MNNELYHYTNSGLDYVYLANGFIVEETPYGRSIAIHRADDLHAVIARDIVTRPGTMRGQEVRFLRSQLALSQAGLGKVLGMTRDAVAKWEGKPNDVIPGQADRALRMFYALKATGHETALQICELLEEIDELQFGETVFEEAPFGWSRRAA